MIRITVFLFAISLFATPKKALIFGVTGQDGSYLAELLLEKGYEVHGVKRRSSSHNTSRIDLIYEDPQETQRRFILHYGDLADSSNVFYLIQTIEPDEVYNLAAQSHVKVSFESPEYTADVNALGTLRILEAIRLLGLTKKVKYYQASTSEMFGLVQEMVQCENTPFYPRSPYGVSKVFGYWATVNYREAYGIFACNGILFNHESPRREYTFVTKKITKAVARISLGLQDRLYLGNLDAVRDWGYAKDYVYAMWQILQEEEPDDFVIATGEEHTVREFVEESFKYVGIEIEWQGKGLEEIGIDKETGQILVCIDERYLRPSEVDFLKGNYKKAKETFGWEPKTTFKELVQIMVESDLKDARIEQLQRSL